MMITIADVLGAVEIAAVRESLTDAPFVDGKATAGASAREVKSNLQGRSDAPVIRGVSEKARRALEANSVFSTAALPVQFGRILVSRFDPGMSYGWHTDEAFIDNVRTDLSFTLFLSNPEDYDGGALELTNSAGNDLVRLPTGHVVVYWCDDLHRVSEVTRGERLAVVSWLQSRVRSSKQRDLRFKLAAARAEIQDRAPETALALAGIRQQLLRMWSDA